MIRANARVVLEGQSFQQSRRRAARRERSAVRRRERARGRDAAACSPRCSRNTRQHLRLVAISLLAAILVGVPLGVLAARSRRWRAPILSLAGLLQTDSVAGAARVPDPAARHRRRAGAGRAVPLQPAADRAQHLRRAHHHSRAARRVGRGARAVAPAPSSFGVRLPMASPAIMAGIKTSAVINVGHGDAGGADRRRRTRRADPVRHPAAPERADPPGRDPGRAAGAAGPVGVRCPGSTRWFPRGLGCRRDEHSANRSLRRSQDETRSIRRCMASTSMTMDRDTLASRLERRARAHRRDLRPAHARGALRAPDRRAPPPHLLPRPRRGVRLEPDRAAGRTAASRSTRTSTSCSRSASTRSTAGCRTSRPRIGRGARRSTRTTARVRAIGRRMPRGPARALRPDPTRTTVFNMAIEHRLMHAETLAYLLHQLPPSRQAVAPERPPRRTRQRAGAARDGRDPRRPRHARSRARGVGLRLGQRVRGAMPVEVPAFAIDAHKVTNGELPRLRATPAATRTRALWCDRRLGVDRAAQQHHAPGVLARAAAASGATAHVRGDRPLPLDGRCT